MSDTLNCMNALVWINDCINVYAWNNVCIWMHGSMCVWIIERVCNVFMCMINECMSAYEFYEWKILLIVFVYVSICVWILISAYAN